MLLVAAGGVAGVLSRYAISLPFHGPALSWVTMAINVAGSFLLGVLIVVDWWSPEIRTALGVGFLGGFTTFSTFSVQAVADIEAGEPGAGAALRGRIGSGRAGRRGAGMAVGRALMA